MYSCLSYLYTAERTLCADCSACSHTHQAPRGKETYGVFCIHFGFKIASLLLSFPSMASWKDSNELETPCLLWQRMHAHNYIPWLDIFHEFDKHICYDFLLLDCFCILVALIVHPKFYFTQIWFWLLTCILSHQAKFRRYPTMVTVTGKASRF